MNDEENDSTSFSLVNIFKIYYHYISDDCQSLIILNLTSF